MAGRNFHPHIRETRKERTTGKPRSANEWATWKESSPFIPDSRRALRATLEDESHDNRRQAIQYILLHELGHVLSVAGNFHPDWNLPPPGDLQVGRYPFFDISWTVDAARSRVVNRFDGALPEAKDTVYYFGAKLPAAQMAAAYEHLKLTPFPTLYAVTHYGDDFAESFANYVHVVLMKRPWEITVRHDGERVTRMGACWDEARCADKRRMLEAIVKSP